MPSERSPWERGYRNVTLNAEAHRCLTGFKDARDISTSAAIIGLVTAAENADGAPTEEWLTYALGRLKVRDPVARNNWRRVAGLPDEKVEEW